MGKLILGIGVNDRSISSRIDGSITKEYRLWYNMLTRAASKTYQDKHPTYKDCTVSEMFKHFHLFHAWCQEQVGFRALGYCLDKDLLLKGNKQYSETLCVFLPAVINQLLVKNEVDRGDLPIGVSRGTHSYRASCSINHKYTHIGSYKTPDEAFEGYKAYKENYIKKLAEEYKPTIDPRAYQALLHYKVEKGD